MGYFIPQAADVGFRSIAMEEKVVDYPKGKKVVSPDVEVVVRNGIREVVCVAFFADGYGGFDVLVGVADFNLRDAYASTLDSCAAAVREAVPVEMASDDAEEVHRPG